MKTRKIALLSILFGILFLFSGCKDKKISDQDITERFEKIPTITWGVKVDTKLFGLMNVKTGEIEGFDIDIAKAITKQMLGEEGKVEFVEVTSKTRIPLLKNGNIDAIIATMTITDARKKVVDFSNVYFEAGQSLLVKKGSSIRGIEDVNNNTIVLTVKGSTPAENIRKMVPGVKVLELENYAEAFTALKAGQGDTLTTDNAILFGMAVEDPNYEVVGEIFTDEPYGIAINKGQENFLREVNIALEEIKKNGVYDEIYNKWFPKNK